MVTSQVTVVPEFNGSPASKKLAAAAYEVLRGKGMFMSDYSPISATVEELGAFLEARNLGNVAALRTALVENSIVFSLVVIDDVELVQTTRLGTAPQPNNAPSTHSLAKRFITPLPKPERPARPVVERPRVDPNWATYSVPDYEDEDEEAYLNLPDEDEQVDVVVVAETEAPVAEAPVATVEAVVEAAAAVLEVEAVVEAEPELIVETAPVEAAPEPAPAPAPVRATRPAPVVSDFSNADDDALAAAINDKLTADSRIAHFGDLWMAEDQVARLGRNDIRRIKEYISEQEQPLTDETLAQDVLNVRPNSADYGNLQFAINYRLAHEHKDFDFVGTNNQRFWSTSSLPQIGTTRRKPNDIGTDYRYLVEEVPADVQPRSVKSVSHVLSFYEFAHGLLPLNAELQALLPKQVLPEQRSSVLTFEIPQFYTTYLVEMRFPTPNRGGFLLGLDDFYAESLVPGALIEIKATDNDGHYLVEFLPGANQSERLLDLDDRRSPRFHFRPTTFACEVSPEWLISEAKYPRLGNEKPLDDKIRRRADAVVEATFERVGIEDGDSLIATFPELLAVANIERPFSDTLLKSTLDQLSGASTDDGDTYTYVRS